MEPLETRINGWEKRGIYDDPKLTQIVKMYKEIGFSVKVEPFKPGIESGIEPGIETECTECIKENPDKYKVLYTKKNEPE